MGVTLKCEKEFWTLRWGSSAVLKYAQKCRFFSMFEHAGAETRLRTEMVEAFEGCISVFSLLNIYYFSKCYIEN